MSCFHRTWFLRSAALLIGGVVLLSVVVLPAAADVVTLKDGTKVEGEVKKLGSTYQVKLPDGKFKFIPERDVESVTTDEAGAEGSATGSPKAGASENVANRAGFSNEFYEIKKRADDATEPVKAVTLWERHLNRKGLSDAEREAADKELAAWKKLYTEGAEKIKNRWLVGEDLKKIKDEADRLVKEGFELEQKGSVLDAVENYQQAIRLYPNCFPAHFRLGYLELKQSSGGGPGTNKYARSARRSLDAALRLQPENPAVLSNYGACLVVLGDYQKGIEHLWKAVEKAETPQIVGNLLTALDGMPRNFYTASAKMRDINNRANTLRERYRSGGGLLYINDPYHGMEAPSNDSDKDQGPPGLMGNGSGFFITADGYLLTNRHVAETNANRYYRVRLAEKDADGNYVEYLARFIAADDKYDVALLKVDLPEGVTVPYLKVLEDDYPPVQADVLTLGYPTAMTRSFVLQTARGQVNTTDPAGDEDFDIWLDIKTTQGNSGGPIVDRNGHVIGLLTAYRKVYDSIISLAVGPRQIRDFLSGVPEAPSLTQESAADRSFDAQRLVDEVKPATLLVLIFRGNLDGADSGGGDAPENAPPSRGGGGQRD